MTHEQGGGSWLNPRGSDRQQALARINLAVQSPPANDSSEFADRIGVARPENCVEASLEITVPPSIMMIVVHHEFTWVG